MEGCKNEWKVTNKKLSLSLSLSLIGLVQKVGANGSWKISQYRAREAQQYLSSRMINTKEKHSYKINPQITIVQQMVPVFSNESCC